MSMNEAPSIIEQAAAGGFSAAFYDFRKANVLGIDYFNPALVRRSDGLWLVTRRSIADVFEFGRNDLMAFKLNEDHLPLWGVPIHPPKVSTGEHFEDPRAFMFAGRWWISACNFVVYPNASWTGAHQVLLEIDDEWNVNRRRDPVYGGNGTDVFNQKGNEKNWLWFEHDGRLHLIYMTEPHVVIEWCNALNVVAQYTDTGWYRGWRWGHCRGGTAPILAGDRYFSFFHSSLDWRNLKRRYFMGAYSFEAHPPFRVLSVTLEPLLQGSIDDPWGEGKPLVVFPCAALFEEGNWTVSLGVNDMASARMTISHEQLIGRMTQDIAPAPATSIQAREEIVYA